MSAATVLGAGGILNPDIVLAAAAAVGLPVALAAAVLEQETGGGRNVWGHDPVENRGIYVPGGPVTEAAYRQYKVLADRGEIGRQGVGPLQLTGRDWQDAADRRGGCWDPTANLQTGFAGLATLVNRYGLPDGVRRYNGTGPAAERYRDRVLTRYQVWIMRLANDLPEDDMQPDERAALFAIRDSLAMLKPGVRLPGRGTAAAAVTDDQYGWVLNGAGSAADALAAVQKLREDLARGVVGVQIDYAALAKALLAAMATP